MGSVTKDSIFLVRRKPTESIDVPEWGGTVHLTPMSGTDRYSFFKRDEDGRTDDGRAALLVRTLTDESGDRLFTNEDEVRLGEQDAQLLDRLAKVALRVNGMGDDAHEDAKKNSTPQS